MIYLIKLIDAGRRVPRLHNPRAHKTTQKSARPQNKMRHTETGVCLIIFAHDRPTGCRRPIQ